MLREVAATATAELLRHCSSSTRQGDHVHDILSVATTAFTAAARPPIAGGVAADVGASSLSNASFAFGPMLLEAVNDLQSNDRRYAAVVRNQTWKLRD